MKFVIFAFAFVAAALADVNELPSNEYLPPVQGPVEAVAVQEAVVGPAPFEAEPAHELAQDGYRYKTVKRYRFRHRRDVNELPSNEYLPPVQEAAPIQEPISFPAPVEAEPAHELAQDGYRYKTVKRYRFRHRRDVNELPSNEYLPPVQGPVEAVAVQEAVVGPAPVEAEPAHELAQDGYRYKTVKRYRFRHRRDVNELPSNEYLPPVQGPVEAVAIQEAVVGPAPVEAEPAHELAQDGYRYKTVKRYRFRHRRDVNELPSNEYLPPVQEAAPIQEPISFPAPVEAEPAHELAQDGYRYKTVKRYRFRHRRDVNELPSNEYLPPVQGPVEAVAVQEAVVGPAPVEAEPAHELAQDGYRYKTVKRYRFRHRRDVNELPSNEYLPPVQEAAPIAEPIAFAAPVEAEPAHELAQDGYRYKTVKRYRFRHRRDVNELPSNEYLPPVQEAAPIPEPVAFAAPVEAEPAHELAQDGYRYKTVKRYRFRHRRDVNELPSNEYLPPVQAPVEAVAVQEAVVGPAPVEAEPAHELAQDGYRYKTVKRYRFRHRRDVNELPSNEYLPPVQETIAPVPEQVIIPEVEPAHDLAQDGYRYKTVKRYRFRHRRDVNELPSNEYLPPVQEAAPIPEPVAFAAPVEAEPAHELAQDGYRYKTVKRYRLRRH